MFFSVFNSLLKIRGKLHLTNNFTEEVIVKKVLFNLIPYFDGCTLASKSKKGTISLKDICCHRTFYPEI